MSPTDSAPAPGTEQPSTGTQTTHKHAVSSADLAVVVGKCVKAVTAANEEIEVLVDIAG